MPVLFQQCHASFIFCSKGYKSATWILDFSVNHFAKSFRTENEASMALLEQNRHLLNLKPQSNMSIKMIRATVSKQQIFIGGFSRNIDNQKMFDHFNSLGVVGEVIIKVHQDTGISRCFGFVTFIDEENLVETLTSKRFHQIWGKGVEINRATSLSAQNRKSRASSRANSCEEQSPALRANLQFTTAHERPCYRPTAYTHRRSRYVPLSHRNYEHFPDYHPYAETYSGNRSRSSVYAEPGYEIGYSAAEPLYFNDSRARYYYGRRENDFISVPQVEKRKSYDDLIPVVAHKESEKRRKISDQSNQSKGSQFSGVSSLSSQALPWMEVGARSRKGSNNSRHSNTSAKQESAFAMSDMLDLAPFKRF
jgi:RNA recognition motif-containing protein